MLFFFLIGFFSGLCYMDKAQRVVSQTSVQSSVGPWYLRRNQWGDFCVCTCASRGSAHQSSVSWFWVSALGKLVLFTAVTSLSNYVPPSLFTLAWRNS